MSPRQPSEMVVWMTKMIISEAKIPFCAMESMMSLNCPGTSRRRVLLSFWIYRYHGSFSHQGSLKSRNKMGSLREKKSVGRKRLKMVPREKLTQMNK